MFLLNGEILGLSFTLWLIMGCVGGIVAQSKNRGFGIGFLLGFLLGPIGLIIVLCLGKAVDHNQVFMMQRAYNSHRQPAPQPQIACSICGSAITRENAFCPSCGTPIAWDQMPAQAPTQIQQRPKRRHRMR